MAFGSKNEPNAVCDYEPCGAPFFRRPSRLERDRAAGRSVYCSKECASAATAISRPANQTCAREACGAPFHRDPKDVRRAEREGRSLYCSPACAAADGMAKRTGTDGVAANLSRFVRCRDGALDLDLAYTTRSGLPVTNLHQGADQDFPLEGEVAGERCLWTLDGYYTPGRGENALDLVAPTTTSQGSNQWQTA